MDVHIFVNLQYPVPFEELISFAGFKARRTQANARPVQQVGKMSSATETLQCSFTGWLKTEFPVHGLIFPQHMIMYWYIYIYIGYWLVYVSIIPKISSTKRGLAATAHLFCGEFRRETMFGPV